MRSWYIVAGLALVAGTASAQGSSDPAILTLVQSFNDARNRFDAKALDGLLAPDYVEVSPRGEIDRRPHQVCSFGNRVAVDAAAIAAWRS